MMLQGINSNEWTRSLLKASLKFLQLSLFFLVVSVVLFWSSLFLHMTVIHSFVPSTSFKWPVFLQFNDCNGKAGVCSNPIGVVVLNEEEQGRISPPPSLITSEQENNLNFNQRKYKLGKKFRGSDIEEEDIYYEPSHCGKYGCKTAESSQVFSRGQSYSAQVLLKVPDSPSNRDLGMFQVEVSLHDKKDQVITSVRRAVRIPYQSYMHRLLYESIKIPFIFLETGTTVSHSLSLPMIESYIDDSTRPAQYLKVRILSRHIEWESCHVEFVTYLSGLRYLLHHHPILSFILSVSVNIFVFGFIGAIILHYLKKSSQYSSSDFMSILRNTFLISGSFSSTSSIESSSRSSTTAKEFEEEFEIEEVMSPEKELAMKDHSTNDEICGKRPIKTEPAGVSSIKTEPEDVASPTTEPVEDKKIVKTEPIGEVFKSDIKSSGMEFTSTTDSLNAENLESNENKTCDGTLEVKKLPFLSEGNLRKRLTKEPLNKREPSPCSSSSSDRSDDFTILSKNEEEFS